jgi:hypothetical protein
MARPSTADILGRLSSDLHSVAIRLEYGPPSHRNSEDCIAEVERICAAARAAVRGNGR